MKLIYNPKLLKLCILIKIIHLVEFITFITLLKLLASLILHKFNLMDNKMGGKWICYTLLHFSALLKKKNVAGNSCHLFFNSGSPTHRFKFSWSFSLDKPNISRFSRWTWQCILLTTCYPNWNESLSDKIRFPC